MKILSRAGMTNGDGRMRREAEERMITAEALIKKFQEALADKWGYIWGTSGQVWTEADQKNLVNAFVKKYGNNWKNSPEAKEQDKYLSAVNGAKWIGCHVADCSGLFLWAFRQLGGSIAHGSNSIYRSYCSSKGKLQGGKRTDGQALLPGTAVFTGKSADSHPHIGLYVGDGNVIEAMGSVNGVTTSKITNSKWTYWGELKDVRYGAAEPGEEPEPGQDRPTIRKGDRGEAVTECQEILVDLGYDIGASGVDGKFGAKTEAAIKLFQKRHGLTADGIVGPKTWAQLLLYEGDEPETYTVTIKGLTKEQASEICREWSGASMKKD